MAKKNYTTEQIIVKLREVELFCGQGKTIAEAVRQTEISEQTYYRWRKEYGGMNTADAKRLKELEKENSRLKKLVADLSLDNAILMINRWVTYYNEIRPHSSLGGRPPAPQTIIPITA